MQFLLACFSLAALPTAHGERLQDGVADLVSVSAHHSRQQEGVDEECTDATEECYNVRRDYGKTAGDSSYVEKFVQNWCEEKGYVINDDVALRAFVRYFDGECKVGSFTNLETALEAAAGQTCVGDWLTAPSSPTASLSELSAEETLIAGGEALRAARVAMHKTSSEIASNSGDDDTKKAGLAQFVKTMLTVASEEAEIDEVKLDLFVTDYLNGDSRVYKYGTLKDALVNNENIEAKRIVAQGTPTLAAAPETFTDQNFDEAAATAATMAIYIHQLMDDLDYEVSNYAGLLGMAPWYTEQCIPQSLERLKEELVECLTDETSDVNFQCGGWLNKV